LNLPNLLSLTRLPLALAFVLVDSAIVRGVLIVTAGFTDFIDGWLARHFGLRTRTGELLDPITDKIFTLVVLSTLMVERQIVWWELLVLLLRDLYNTVMFVVAKMRRLPIRFSSRMSGKVVTVLQIATVFAVLLLPGLAGAVLLITAAASLYSIYDYTQAGRAALRRVRRSG
jgi:CDP-diacylglycerol--glycerol-3-phosphate 3-phosphatidyltransferase